MIQNQHLILEKNHINKISTAENCSDISFQHAAVDPFPIGDVESLVKLNYNLAKEEYMNNMVRIW